MIFLLIDPVLSYEIREDYWIVEVKKKSSENHLNLYKTKHKTQQSIFWILNLLYFFTFNKAFLNNSIFFLLNLNVINKKEFS